MSSFNSITLVGNLGRDPELRYSQNGTPVCQFSMATNEEFNKGGEKQKITTWFRVTCFGRQGEMVSQYLEKGRQCCVIGRLRIEEWEDKEGKKRWTAEVTADRVQFLGSKPDGEDREKFDHDVAKGKQGRKDTTNDEDIPF